MLIALGTLAGCAAIAVITALAEHKFGLLGLVVPAIVVGLAIGMGRPFAMVVVTLGLTLLCEGTSVDIPVMHDLYTNLYGGVEPVDLLVTATFFAVVADLIRRGRQPRLPAVPALALTFVVLATVGGVFVGSNSGQTGLKQAALVINPIVELVVMAFCMFNLDLSDERRVKLIRWGIAMAAVKAIMGLVVMSLGLSQDLDAHTTITYYEPTANWLGLMTVFGLLAAGLGDGSAVRAAVGRPMVAARQRLHVRAAERDRDYRPLVVRPSRRDRRRWAVGPVTEEVREVRTPLRPSTVLLRGLRSRWGVAVFALVFVCLLLSYRRSFWVGGALGLIILIPIASTPRKRLMILPVLLLLGGAVWTLQAVDSQAVAPIVHRATSLQPGQLRNDPEAYYRVDEEANVIATIKHSPLTGLGVNVPWVASVRSLGIEHVDGRLYVDFGLLWWWLKLGVLGAAAYLGLFIAMGTMALQTWRRHGIRELKCFGLASLCGVFALLAIETTAAFTGVDPRFSVLFGAQFGLLAALADRGSETPVADPDAGERASRTHAQDVAWANYQRRLTSRSGG